MAATTNKLRSSDQELCLGQRWAINFSKDCGGGLNYRATTAAPATTAPTNTVGGPPAMGQTGTLVWPMASCKMWSRTK